jgi:formylglycine-generating enzyme required for sulfatase activity
MVVMAAKAEQIAEDGTDHSPFAAALLAHLQIPGLELSLFFRSVRDTVLRATHNRQEPYVFSSLGADPFFFNPRPPNRPPEIDRITPLEIAEVSGPTPLGMPQPTDPDGDTLTIRFIGLPRFGEVRIDGKAVTLNTIVNADQLRNATYKPDGKTLGPAGSVDILVEDGRGGSITGSLPVSVQSSHRPPVIGAPGRVQVSQQFLDIPAPVSPDGDTLVIKVAALPIGTIRNGSAVVHVGDLLSPQELAGLTFWPEAGFTGHAGTLRYRVDNQHGSVVEGSAEVDVGAPVTVAIAATRSPAAQPPPERPESTPEIAPPVKPPSTVATAANAAIVPLLQGSPPRGQAPAGNNFQDCPDCLRMVRIPAGSFTMGEGAHEPESLPAHRVDVKSFAIGQAPVTVADWKACMKAEMCKFMPRMRLSEDLTPVHNVSWDDIGQFMGWLLKVSGRPYRLPSEAEWEYAARGKTTSRYWWGDSVGMSLANCSDCGGRQDMYGPLPVDALPPNPFGLLDMLGGVAEWTADCWFPNYKGAPSDATPRDTKFCERRVLRGGSFRAPHDEITVYYRASYDAPVRYLVNGFRVARDIE